MHPVRRTKIVATIGPASDEPAVLTRLLEAGVDTCRVGLAHGDIEVSIERIERIRAAAKASGRHIGIMADLPGPKIRAARFPEGGSRLVTGETIRLVQSSGPDDASTADTIAVDLDGLLNGLQVGDRIALGDGGAELLVTEVDHAKGAKAAIRAGGLLQGRPGVALPPERFSFASPTHDDLVKLERVIAAGVDMVAVSFVREAADMRAVRAAAGPDGPSLIAKIETRSAVDDLAAILLVSDGVMVARGDLGVRLPMEEVPHIQKKIIRDGVSYGKPVITATQMLESMINAPVPTRAEVTDVANAVFDGTSAVMLSAETAIGVDPVAAVAAMAKITERAEREFDYVSWGRALGQQQTVQMHDAPASIRITSAITAATWRASVDAELAAILCCTNSGATARAISRFRPTAPILGITPFEKTARALSMAWGIRPIVVDEYDTADEIVWFAVQRAVDLGVVGRGDIVAVLVGSPDEEDAATDVLRLVRVK